jgi:hypothetical protein
MATTADEFQSIVEYIQRKVHGPIGDTNYDEWKASRVKRKKKVEGKYIEDWKKWWELWPVTKSVPGTNYICGAKMRGSEQKMYEKWLAAIEAKAVTIEELYTAADSYLAWGYSDSKRKGRNELESRSGMEPWLNQKQYMIYKDLAKPEVKQQIAVTSGDIDI